MKKLQTKMIGLLGRVDRRTIQVLMLILTISMLVIGAAAPEIGGEPGGPGPLPNSWGGF